MPNTPAHVNAPGGEADVSAGARMPLHKLPESAQLSQLHEPRLLLTARVSNSAREFGVDRPDIACYNRIITLT